MLALLEALRVAPPEEGEPTIAIGILEIQRRADLIRLRQALGTAIAFTAGPEQFDAIVALIQDPASGGARAS